MSELEQLFVKYGTDKGYLNGNGWNYTPVYEHYLETRRDSVRNVLEIGICGFRDIPNNVVGASLFVWKDYFPKATIYGVDNDARFIFNDQQAIVTRLTDAYDRKQLDDTMLLFGAKFDFICDDAVHDPGPQILLCRQLWPHLAVGGVYAVEDCGPYKLGREDMEPMVLTLMAEHPDMRVMEYSTGKPEHLLILQKDPPQQ